MNIYEIFEKGTRGFCEHCCEQYYGLMCRCQVPAKTKGEIDEWKERLHAATTKAYERAKRELEERKAKRARGEYIAKWADRKISNGPFESSSADRWRGEGFEESLL